MKRLFAAALVVSGLVFGLSGVSGAADVKIGYVDFAKVQADSKGGKDIMGKLEKMFKEKQAQLDQRQEEIEKAMQELEKQSAVLSSDVKKQKEERLQKDYRDLQRFKADSEEELNKKKAELVKQMNGDISAVIGRFGREEGYALILERTVVLYAPETNDITDQITKAYDATK